MSLLKELERIREDAQAQIAVIRKFLKEIHQTLAAQQSAIQPSSPSPQEAGNLAKLLKACADENRVPSFEQVYRASPRGLQKSLLDWAFLLKHQELLADMTLSQLVAVQEVFIKDYACAILGSRKRMLRRRKKTLTYEEVYSHTSMRALIGHMARRLVDAETHGSIDDTAAFLETRLGIPPTDYSQWGTLRNATYRRNLILHNRGITNDTYCKATGFKKRGERLHTQTDDVMAVAQALLGFVDFLHARIILKFKLNRHSEARTGFKPGASPASENPS